MERIHGDTLLAYQRYPARVVLFAPNGQYVRTYTVVRPGAEGAQAEFPALNFKSAYDDGTLLVSRHPGTEHGSKLGVTWIDSVRPQRVDREGKLLGDFGKHWDHDATRVPSMSPPPPDKPYMSSFPSRPRSAIWGMAGEQMFYSPRERFEIALRNKSGNLTRIVRMATNTIRRTPADSAIMEFEGGDAPSVLVTDSTGKAIAIAVLPKPSTTTGKTWRLVSNNRDIGRDHFTTMAVDGDERAYVLVFRINRKPAQQGTP